MPQIRTGTLLVGGLAATLGAAGIGAIAGRKLRMDKPGPSPDADRSIQSPVGIPAQAARLLKEYDSSSDGIVTYGPVNQASTGKAKLRTSNEAVRTVESLREIPDADGLQVVSRDTWSRYPLFVAADWVGGSPDGSVQEGDLMTVMRQFDRADPASGAKDDRLDDDENASFEHVFRERLMERSVLSSQRKD